VLVLVLVLVLVSGAVAAPPLAPPPQAITKLAIPVSTHQCSLLVPGRQNKRRCWSNNTFDQAGTTALRASLLIKHGEFFILYR
jgi:hypothetical protein